MLHNLHIQNYALIENLDINFESGFSVITGETGAGKSILLGALALILGGRADSSAISPGATRCIAEATFRIAGPDIREFFDSNDLDYDEEECIIRRELTTAGKSRAFINDTPVSLSVVKELSARLIDVHSQHQNLLLNSNRFILDVVDAVAGSQPVLADYSTAYRKHKECTKELERLRDLASSEAANTDFLQFQIKELSSAALEASEQETLEEEQLILNNAENIKESIYSASSTLDDVLDKLHSAHTALEHILSVYPTIDSLTGRIDSARIELDDIQSDLSSRINNIDFDPQRADYVTQRLNTIYTLQKKYHKTSVEELLQLQLSLEEQLNQISNSSELLEQKEKECQALHKELKNQADKLTHQRQLSVAKTEKAVTEQLKLLGMPDVIFRVDIKPLDNLSPTGQDDVTFLFSSNKNMPPLPIAKIASGGEIARVMLSLKALLSAHKELPTIIFDEIDTGVSGNISDKMATVMKTMAQHGLQVICITHQPQIAAAGQHHYRVYKENSADKTHSHIELLSLDDRVQEIAKMLSGQTLTEAAITNAKTLLKI